MKTRELHRGEASLSTRQKIRQLLASVNESCNWLEGMFFSESRNGLQIGFIHGYFAQWFHQQARQRFEQAIGSQFSRIEYIQPGSDLQDKHSRKGLKPPDSAKRNNSTKPGAGQSGQKPFDNFICGEKNQSALRLLEKMAFANQNHPSAIILYGASGVGKTMLLNCLESALSANGKKAASMPAADFCVALAAGQYGHSLNNCSLHNADMLLLDDLQALYSQPALATNLANCLDKILHQENIKRPALIMALTAAPEQANEKFQTRLQSKLDEMLWLEIREADLETRLKYAEQVNRANRLQLSRSQIISLVRQAKTLPTIKGMLAKIDFLKKNSQIALLDDYLGQLEGKSADSAPQWKALVEIVAKRFHLKSDDLLGACRKADYALARQIALYLCRRQLGFSLKELGAIFGGRDHSTILHGIKKIQSLRDTDKDMHKLLQELSEAAIFGGRQGHLPEKR